MRFLGATSLLGFVLVATLVSAQEQNPTDAQLNGLRGPVRRVSSSITTSEIQWRPLGEPTFVMPTWCHECEFDLDGTRTKSGRLVDGKFHGEIIRVGRSTAGKVKERFSTDAVTGRLQRREVFGPFGATQQDIYQDGKVEWRDTFKYDDYGHMSDWLSVDGAGKMVGHTITKFEKDGTFREQWRWAKDQALLWEESFDPVTRTKHFTSFDEQGRVKLTWTVVAGKLTSFWEPPDSPSQLGNFTQQLGNGNQINFNCHSNLNCDVSQVHYEFDAVGIDPKSVELQDSEGNLRLRAYFEYNTDSFGNWIQRTVSVWNPELGVQSLLEVDQRAITYWNR